jgi:hypothetical protein
MRPTVGEEMSRQPSLPSLTARGNPGADLASLTRADNRSRPTPPTSAGRIGPARPSTPSRTRDTNHYNAVFSITRLTRPRSFRDAVMCGLAAPTRCRSVRAFGARVRCARSVRGRRARIGKIEGVALAVRWLWYPAEVGVAGHGSDRRPTRDTAPVVSSGTRDNENPTRRRVAWSEGAGGPAVVLRFETLPGGGRRD